MARGKKDPRWSELRLAIIVSSVGILAVVAVLLLGTTRGPFSPDTYSLFVNLDDAAGIRVGSLVRVAGLPAGEVAGVEIVPRDAPRPQVAGDTLLPPSQEALVSSDIRIELSVQEPFQPHITARSRAQLASLGLGGERYVSITAGDVREPPLPPGATVEDIAAVDWDLIIARMARGFNEIAVIAGLVEEIQVKMASGGGTAGRLLDDASPLYASIGDFADQSEALLTLLDEGDGLIPRYRNDPALRQQIDAIRADLAAIDSFSERGALAQWSRPTELQAAVADLREQTGDLDRRLETGQGSLGRFLNDQELHLQIRVLQTRIAELAAAFGADPLGFVNIEVF
jgi:ABC-type transporter Mla subunit MlaD